MENTLTEAPPPHKCRLGVAGWATSFALLISVLTLALTLIGYGYDLAYLEPFGLSPEMVGRSPLDFLMRSYRPLMHWTEPMARIWNLGTFLSWLESWLSSQTVQLLMAALGITLTIAIYLTQAWRPIIRPTLGQMTTALRAHHYIAPALRVFRRLTPRRSRLLGYFGWLAVPLGFVSAASAVYLIMSLVLSLLFVMVVYIPSLGVSSGSADAKIQVITAQTCDLRQARVAPCVRIRDENGAGENVQGRLIDISGGRAYLFVANTGSDGRQFVSVPLDHKTVELVATLRVTEPHP
ncbi:hypothetical protein [Denitromonas ohlonensis]|uniref:Uncharacterized protein n=2 Tax=Denitromonas TaxID=139331 RepID=A0A557SGC6_9RHOO|nr:hypothetical protein [Denitromonas ohlonensis]TVO67609.1 hypothetical protein FHP90_06515 [Denitromonas ohlonensis]TVO76467.1 hypothetical protein FHP89_10210 [Denitromonas ohlonensis]